MERPFPAYEGSEPYIFVSYSHEDAAAVYPEIEWLRQQGVNIWYDEGISPGHEWREDLAHKLRQARLILFFTSPDSVKSVHCRREVNFALDADVDCLTVHLKSTDMPDGLKLSLADLQAILKFEMPEDSYRSKLLTSILARVGPTETQAKVDTVDAQTGWTRFAVPGIGFALIAAVIVLIYRPVPTDEMLRKRASVESVLPVDVSEPVPGFSNRAAIAVMPFVNLSDDPAQEYFVDGITEDLNVGLQSFQMFPIIATTSTFQYKNSVADVRDIASELGVGYLIKGSVRKGEDLIRINVQLIDNLGKQVWADKFTFEFANALRIQDELIRKVLLAIEPALIISEADTARRVRTEDMEAWDYYLQAIPYTFAPNANTNLNGQSLTREQLDYATTLLHKALDLDPNFAAAYRLLNHNDATYALLFRSLIEEEEANARIQRALEYGERARQISPFEPSVCSCQSALLLMTGDLDAAFRLQEEALRMNPSNSGVHAIMAKILQVKGDYRRALKEIDTGKRLSPRDIGMTNYLYFEAAIYQAMGQLDDAINVAQKALLLSPLNYEAQFVMILSHYAKGNVAAAKEALTKLHRETAPEFKPISGWPEPFPTALAERITLDSGAKLDTMDYNEGIQAVFDQLGWNTKEISSESESSSE